MRLLPVIIKTEKEFDTLVTEQGVTPLRKAGVDVASEKISFAGFPAYKLNFLNLTNKTPTSYIFVYRSTAGTFLQIDYAPVGDDVFEQIVSSFTFKDVTLDTMSDQALYVNGVETRDYKYCDRIQNGILRDKCRFEIEGPKTNEINLDFSKLKTEGEAYSGTKLSAGPSKNSKAWFASAISLNKGGAWALEFDVDFVNGESAQGLVSVYLNTTQIGQVDGRVHFPDGDYPDYTFPLPVTGPGLFTLSFRLDTFADGNASATIKNAKLVNIENLPSGSY